MCVIHRPQALTLYWGGVFPAAYFDSDVDKDFITRSSQRWDGLPDFGWGIIFQ